MVKSKKVDPENLIPGADLVPTSDLAIAKQSVAEEGAVDNNPIRPEISSPEWSDYVMGQFKEDELNDGRPNVAGLRRVTELLLGEIVGSSLLSCATYRLESPDGLRHNNFWVSTHEVRINWRDENGGFDPCGNGVRVFSEVGNVNSWNVDPDWLQWGPEFSSTRAEARALRKALKLKGMSSEENAPSVKEIKKREGTIDGSQKNFLSNICTRNGIDLNLYINYGENHYDTIDDIPFDTAVKMIKYLSELQRDQSKIPDSIKKQ